MSSRERNVLAQILKSWAQDHTNGFIISDPEPGDQGVQNTGSFLTWLIQQGETHIDLVSLLDRLELYVHNVKYKKFPDGMFCRKCQSFYKYAEPNRPDGTLLCYSCRNNPYT